MAVEAVASTVVVAADIAKSSVTPKKNDGLRISSAHSFWLDPVSFCQVANHRPDLSHRIGMC
jgi:hypothetical protein